jgi:hypothetical protein
MTTRHDEQGPRPKVATPAHARRRAPDPVVHRPVRAPDREAHPPVGVPGREAHPPVGVPGREAHPLVPPPVAAVQPPVPPPVAAVQPPVPPPVAAVQPPVPPPLRAPLLGTTACRLTAVGLLAWLIGPPLTVVLTSGVALAAQATRAQRAHRAGTCILRDTRMELAFLVAAFVAGWVGMLWPWLA